MVQQFLQSWGHVVEKNVFDINLSPRQQTLRGYGILSKSLLLIQRTSHPNLLGNSHTSILRISFDLPGA